MSIPVARLGNTRVYLHVTFVVVVLVMALSGFALHLLVFAGSLFFHEMGHIIAAAFQGLDLTSVEVWPFGAVGRLERSWQLSPYGETAVALAGPFNSGILCSLALAVERGIVQSQGSAALSQFPLLDLLIKLNLGLFLVNLIPCLPLDGGRFLRAQLALRYGYVVASRRVSQWGLWAGIVITVGAACGIAAGRPHYAFLVIGPLVAWGALDQRSYLGAENVMQILSRSDYLAQRKAIPVQEIVVSMDATVSEVVARLRPSRFHVILPAGKGMKIAGRVTETRILQAFYEGDTGLKMRELLKRN